MPVAVEPAGPEPGPRPEAGAAEGTSPPLASALDLLRERCAVAGKTDLRIQPLPPDAVPQPYRTLLVHSRDMTPTLERFHRHPLGLRALWRGRHGSLYLREVVLVLPDGAVVEYGAIRIDLTWFEAKAREQILAERLPLGRILQENGIAHLGWPQGFYRVEPNAYVEGRLGTTHAPVLYGRRNVLLNGTRRLLADVIEILPPVKSPQPTEGPGEEPAGWLAAPRIN